MDPYLIGAIILVVLALTLFIAGRNLRKADRGGVIVEGNNRGVINTGTINQGKSSDRFVTLLNVLASVLGIIASVLVIVSQI